jgi:hypothetical protein
MNTHFDVKNVCPHWFKFVKAQLNSNAHQLFMVLQV